MNTLNKFLFLLIAMGMLLPCVAHAQDDSLQWSGYFENQAFVQYSNITEELLFTDYNKLRLDMGFEVSRSLTFNADIIFRTYHGTTSYDILDFLPEAIGSQIPGELAPQLVFAFEDDYYINDAYITLYLDGLTIRVGKQQLPWGTGYTWNPTDQFNVKDQLDPTYEKEGVNALKIEIPLGLDGNITAIAANRDNIEDLNYAFKIKKNFFGFDISASYQYFNELNLEMATFTQVEQRRHIIGADFTGQIFDIGFWGEGTYNIPEEGNIYDEEYGEYLLGMDYTFEGGLYIMAEYLHRDRGVRNKADYQLDDFLRMLYAEITNIGTDYLSLGTSYPVTDLITFQVYSIANLQDGSWVVIPWISWDAATNLEISMAGNMFIGENGSEYGEYPSGGFVRIRVYF